ncbi:MAG: HAMP domain-containing protein, partial [Chloroflexi bacterium]|nr:HAMP domain-containing protein [Chloroflexota bacterium]
MGVRWGGLRDRILAWSFVPTAIILLAVALVTFYSYQGVTQDLVIQRDQELVRLSAGQVSSVLKEYTDLLTSVARTSPFYSNVPAAQQVGLQRSRYRLSIFDGGVVVLDTFGLVVAAEPPRPDLVGQDWSDRPFFLQMARSATPGPAFSDLLTDGPAGAPVIAVCVPITGPQGEFLGALAGFFRLGDTAVSTFYGNLVKLRLGQGGEKYLVDSQGQVIYHSDLAQVGENYSREVTVRRLLQGEVGALRIEATPVSVGEFDYRVDQDVLAGFAPVPGTPWGLVTEESWEALTASSRRYQRFLLLLLALGVVVPAVVVTLGLRRTLQPIKELIAAAHEVARGNFGQSIRAATGDEIEELARQFNLMSAQLQASYTHLEQRVADRTRELATLNEVASVLSHSLDLPDVLTAALEKTFQVMGMETGGVYLLDEGT